MGKKSRYRERVRAALEVEYADAIRRMRYICLLGLVAQFRDDMDENRRMQQLYIAAGNELPSVLQECEEELFIRPAVAIAQEHGPEGLIKLAERERWADRI